MEDEILKRNTDCVYFLASPLTCKKGIECEYRHSESARLNPRDCWYWLAGCCLNPTCAFRHPPLDVHAETLSEPAPLPQQSSASTNKTNVPCYFYFNSFCNKGDKCSFLHGPNGVPPAQKSSISAITDIQPLEHNTLTKTDTVPASIEAPPIPSKPTSKAAVNLNFHPKTEIKQLVPNNVAERSPSPQISAPECEDAIEKSESLVPTEDFIESRSLLCRDESSVDDDIEPEERWESSPGFDVLVDDGSENLGYEDDPEYLLAHDQESRDLHNHLIQYEYTDPVGYDPMEYPDVGILYERGLYNDSYDRLEIGKIADYTQRLPKHSRERMLDPKRKYLPQELDFNYRNDIDLRDHLRKRRRIDGFLVPRNPRRRDPSYRNNRSRESSGRHSVSHQLHQRFASEIGKNMITSHSENESESNDSSRRGWLRHSQANKQKRSRQQEKGRRRQTRTRVLRSEISRGSTSRKTRRPSQELAVFTGPMTLSQIKEEKRKARENDNHNGNSSYSSKTTFGDFQGPKPLSEILKDKRRHDNVETERNHKHSYRDDNGFIDEDEDEEEGLEKKLASMFS